MPGQLGSMTAEMAAMQLGGVSPEAFEDPGPRLPQRCPEIKCKIECEKTVLCRASVDGLN
eukprot:161262-Rhodomonas_salina.1